MQIEVSDMKEAALIRDGLSIPEVRALVKVMGVLEGLPTLADKRRAIVGAMARLTPRTRHQCNKP